MRSRFFVCLFLLLSAFSVCLSQNIDSLKTVLRSSHNDTLKAAILCALIESENDEKVWPKYNDELYQIARTNRNKSKNDTVFTAYLSYALNNYGYYYMEQDDYVKARKYYEEALEIELKSLNKASLASVYNNIGYLLRMQGNVSEALDYYHKALKQQIATKDQYGMASSYNNIGYVFESQNEVKKALEYYRKSLEIYSKIGKKDGLAIGYGNIAYIYKQYGDPDESDPKLALEKGKKKALDYFRQSLALFKELNDQNGVADNLNLIGHVLLSESKSCDDDIAKEAMNYFEESLSIRLAHDFKSGLADSYNTIGRQKLSCNDLKTAEQYARKDLEISQQIGNPEKIQDAAHLLFEVSRKLGNYKEALDMHVLYLQMRDSILNANTRKDALKKTFQIEYEKKALADSVRTADERRVFNAELKQQRTQKIALFAGIALVGLFSAFMYNRFRVTRKQKLLIEQKEKETNEQKVIIEKKHQEITDSINYANRIQRALMTSEHYINKHLKRMRK